MNKDYFQVNNKGEKIKGKIHFNGKTKEQIETDLQLYEDNLSKLSNEYIKMDMKTIYEFFAPPRKISQSETLKIPNERITQLFDERIRCSVCKNFTKDIKCFKNCLHVMCKDCSMKA
jgi:hypothetical protein